MIENTTLAATLGVMFVLSIVYGIIRLSFYALLYSKTSRNHKLPSIDVATICVLMAGSFVIFLFAGSPARIGWWATFTLALLNALLAFGLWKEKRWALLGYLCFAGVMQITQILRGTWVIFAAIPLIMTAAILLLHYKDFS